MITIWVTFFPVHARLLPCKFATVAKCKCAALELPGSAVPRFSLFADADAGPAIAWRKANEANHCSDILISFHSRSHLKINCIAMTASTCISIVYTAIAAGSRAHSTPEMVDSGVTASLESPLL